MFERPAVQIIDVSPRDGLQNEAGIISTADKVHLVRLLEAAGLREIEVTSFVSPRWVPQLADAREVLAALAAQKPADANYIALTPNEKGMDALLQVNADAGRRVVETAAVFTAASETFSRKNTNATIAETIERFRPVVRAARGAGLRIRGYVSCVVACPYEGAIAPQQATDVAKRLLDLGIDELDLGETIGAGTPDTVAEMLTAVLAASAQFAGVQTTLHLHDTFGRAADCVRAALELGVRRFDGSVAGLGGCPFASTPGRRAPGNIATELLVGTVESAGYKTAVARERLTAAAVHARRMIAPAPAGEN
ncbi:Hydroxymethylglutaryl-CoA lyase YngG [Phycisphaerae bacterium RAS1]|nr:Hydroxymethylglutaryl-CoA lyase YngG [Phycisphaerae bacterium RAS1]